MKYEITVLATDSGATVLADRCTLEAPTLQDAADKYARLFVKQPELEHTHRHAGQTLRHRHADGQKPHDYFEHPEDAQP